MQLKININSIYAQSKDVVARTIQGEFIIIPIASGIGDLEDEVFSLNDTGQAIWNKLNGKKSLLELESELKSEFEGPVGQIEKDILGLTGELLKRRMLVEVKRA